MKKYITKRYMGLLGIVGIIGIIFCGLWLLTKERKMVIDRLYVFAFDAECAKLWPLVQRIEKNNAIVPEDIKVITKDRIFKLMRHNKGKFYILITSVGPLNSVYALTRVLSLSTIQHVINIGYVGGITFDVDTKIIVTQCKDLSYYVPENLRMLYNVLPINIGQQYREKLKTLFPEAKEGVLGSSGKFIDEKHKRVSFKDIDIVDIDIVDMEGFYLAALVPDKITLLKVVSSKVALMDV